MNSLLSAETKHFLTDNKGEKIVFTNGCFDILHVGHVKYLNEAKACGEILFVGLNSDASVAKLKGDKRPINNELDRKYLLENLKCVDWVEIFHEETPYKLIESISPEVLVKGGDWKKEDIVGFDLVEKRGGIVKSLSYRNGYSTTGVIDRIIGLG